MNENEDFDALRNNLKYLKLSLENERVKAQEKLFLDFTQTVMVWTWKMSELFYFPKRI